MTKPSGLKVEIRDASPFQLQLDFQLADGASLAILGSSGSGKTSLLKIIAGLHKRSDATIYFGSHLWQNKSKQLPAKKRPIAYLAQTPALFEHFSIAKNLDIFSRSSKELSDWLLDSFMIGDLLNKKPSQLSGGEKQKICLLRALLQKPKLLLLDEPFSGIDATTKEFLEICIKQYQKRYATCLIFVSHDISEAMRLCSQAMIMSQGKIIDMGCLDSIRNEPSNLESAKFFGCRNYLPTIIEAVNTDSLTCSIAGRVISLPKSGLNFKKGEKAYVLIKNHHYHADSTDIALEITNHEIIELENAKKLLCQIKNFEGLNLIFPIVEPIKSGILKKIFLKKDELRLIDE